MEVFPDRNASHRFDSKTRLLTAVKSDSFVQLALGPAKRRLAIVPSIRARHFRAHQIRSFCAGFRSVDSGAHISLTYFLNPEIDQCSINIFN
ncbi:MULTISPECIES: hypothetical protein [unclassified Bradyrhizobium]|uniref:hypothetical protein n=1 Tax=unclassified Bradyrhizobium TaxID=2631580 RepID=UPI0012EC524C|nr:MULTISPECIES: hypothetical protein [unclassified Bradyrhizobium]QIG93276.1 hypothetical protein G6P99_12740 [Bradyrhizobium sp. 6(2017)]